MGILFGYKIIIKGKILQAQFHICVNTNFPVRPEIRTAFVLIFFFIQEAVQILFQIKRYAFTVSVGKRIFRQ